jgi:hypothetical protein
MSDLDKLLSKDKKVLEEKKIIGRPKKKDKATNKITCYLNDEDFNLIKEKANEELNLSYYLKKLIQKDLLA